MAKKAKEVKTRPFGFYFSVDSDGYPSDWDIVEDLDKDESNPNDYDYALILEVPVPVRPPAKQSRIQLNPK